MRAREMVIAVVVVAFIAVAVRMIPWRSTLEQRPAARATASDSREEEEVATHALAQEASQKDGDAVVTCSAFLDRHPDATRVLWARGNAFSDLLQHEKALADFERLTVLTPTEPAPYVNAPWEHYCQGRYEAALKEADRSLQLLRGKVHRMGVASLGDASLRSCGSTSMGRGDPGRRASTPPRSCRQGDRHQPRGDPSSHRANHGTISQRNIDIRGNSRSVSVEVDAIGVKVLERTAER